MKADVHVITRTVDEKAKVHRQVPAGHLNKVTDVSLMINLAQATPGRFVICRPPLRHRVICECGGNKKRSVALANQTHRSMFLPW